MTQRTSAAFATSLALHAAVAVFTLWRFARHSPPPVQLARAESAPTSIVWIAQAGPGGGGGGGGNGMPEPPRQAQLPGHDKVTVPVSPATPDPADVKPEQPTLNLDIPATTLASANLTFAGMLDGPPNGASQGPGTGDGAGTGKGDGIGPGNGSGLGDGSIRGIGGQVYQPGNGVTGPTATYRETPHYTVEAMRAHVQGSVFLQCVVQTTGNCTDIRVLRTPDPPFGLDQEAVTAALHWRFLPGTRMGQPVPVRITMELAFSIH